MPLKIKHNVLTILSLLTLIVSTESNATVIKLLNSKNIRTRASMSELTQLVKRHFDIDQYRQVNLQIIYDKKQQPDHIIVYLFSKLYHKVETAVINVYPNLTEFSVEKNYRLTRNDFAAQPGITSTEAVCPDPSIEFIAFAPNNSKLEQNITNDVANAAEKHSLKTIRLLKEKATRTNYLNYMKCPKLKGNFYDGDADPEAITTVDGVISYEDINTVLQNQFKYQVTNIWLACQAYNDPIKSAVIVNAQSQKYAAGINDLLVGPSDNTADCAMKAAIDHKPMTASFKACYDKLDTKKDHWGFGGNGSDIFGA